jgi:hypothetical protein
MSQHDPFDLEWLKLSTPPVPLSPHRLPRHKSGEKFVKGPVPWSWIEAAGRLRGQALLVGMLLWREAGCVKSRTVRLSQSRAAGLGMHRDTAKRALRSLQEAGLVSLYRRPGRALDVTLLDAPEKSPTERLTA